jgi:hypothetical protein
MSAQMTAPFSRVYGDETPKAPPAMEASERDSKFQSSMAKLMSSLHDSDVGSRDSDVKKDGFNALDALAGRQTKEDTEKVARYQGPAIAATAAASVAPNPQATREMNALLKTEQASKPLDRPKNTNQVAANAETASQGAKNKGMQAERGADTLVKKANDITAKMSPQEVAGLQPKGDSLVGPMVEMSLHATGHNMAAAAAAVVTVSTGQGQGTYSTEKTPSKPILSKSEERAVAKSAPTRYYDQAPQAVVAPSQPTNTQQFFDKMGKGPGFDTGRLASQDSLKDLKVGNIEKVVENSPAMQSLKSAGQDADNTKLALLSMKDKGLVEDGGKQKLTPELQAFAKPTAPSPAGFAK